MLSKSVNSFFWVITVKHFCSCDLCLKLCHLVLKQFAFSASPTAIAVHRSLYEKPWTTEKSDFIAQVFLVRDDWHNFILWFRLYNTVQVTFRWFQDYRWLWKSVHGRASHRRSGSAIVRACLLLTNLLTSPLQQPVNPRYIAGGPG